MYILDVIPLSRGITKDTLSYFSAQDIAPGTIVTVPLRNKTANALVVGSRSAEESRLELKNATFTFKKISGIASQDLLSKAFVVAAKKSAEYHVASLGSLLFSLVPKIVLENTEHLVSVPSPERKPDFLHGAILQADDDERFSQFRSLVRQEFAKGRSVFLCMPTIGDIRRAEKLFEKGIAEYSYTFHAQIKKKDLVKRWNELAAEKHPVFIIGTGQFLCVPRHDIGTIIIERENSRVYKSQSRPFTDIRHFAEMFAKETGAVIIFGDTLLRTETVWRYRNDEFRDIVPPSHRVKAAAESRVVDMRKIENVTAKFDPISRIVEELIRKSGERGEKLFLFAGRRGLSPITVCSDCSTVVTCRTCKAPTVLHTKSDERFFLCHRCGEKRDAHERCVHCTGWRLQTLGVGIELVAEEIARRFPNQQIFRIDSDSVKTNAQAVATIKKFYESPGGILLGTEMALLYLDEKIENVAIVSMDSMFSIPDFRIREKTLSILIRLRSLATKNFLIQTRNREEAVFEYAEKGNLTDFYNQEIKEREQFDYPPLTVLIKISLSGEKTRVENSMQALVASLPEYDIITYPAFSPFSGGTYTMHTLIKIGRDRWVEPALYEKLRALPPSFSIAVDPESVL
jgi:primosomal protein N'